jgi:AI-2 transport protein TqsA
MAARTNGVHAEQRVQTVCLLILTLSALGFVMYCLKLVLVPFVLALLFTYCLTPIIDVQTRRLGLPRGVAIVDTALLGLLLLALVGLLVASSVGSMLRDFPRYQEQFAQLPDRIALAAPLQRLGIHWDMESSSLVRIQEQAVTQAISMVASEVTGVVSNGALVVVFMIFILSGRQAARQGINGILSQIEARIKRYVIQTVFFSALSAALVGAALAALGVDFAWVFAFLTFLLNFIPSVGSIIATLLPLPVILLAPEMSVTSMVLALAIPAAIQFGIGNVIQPKFQGAALDLHPVTVLMSLIFFGMIWGMVGAFLATPITAVIKIVLDRIPVTRPLAAVMAGNLDALADRNDVGMV